VAVAVAAADPRTCSRTKKGVVHWTVERKKVRVCVAPVCAFVRACVRACVCPCAAHSPPTRTIINQCPCVAQCFKCEKDKPSLDFGLDNGGLGGLTSSCTVCDNARRNAARDMKRKAAALLQAPAAKK
jgi:hypothetical protein